MDDEKRDALLQLLADSVSRTLGELEAMSATLLGALTVLRSHPSVAPAVAQELERAYALLLGSSTNPAQTEAFEAFRERAMACLTAQPADSAAPGEPSSSR